MNLECLDSKLRMTVLKKAYIAILDVGSFRDLL